MAHSNAFCSIFKLCEAVVLYATFALAGSPTHDYATPRHGRYNPGAAAAAAAAAQPTRGFQAKVGSFFWWLGFYGILALAAVYVVVLLWINYGRPFLQWLVELPQHPTVEITQQSIRGRRQRMRERRTEVYNDLVYNWYTDQAAFRWQQLCNFVWDYTPITLAIILVAYVAVLWVPALWHREPEAVPYHKFDRYGYQIPCYMDIAGEANEKGTSRWAGPGSRCDPFGAVERHVPPHHDADKPQPFVDWDEDAFAAAGSHDTTKKGRKESKKGIETTTTTVTVYENDHQPSIETVYEPTTITVNEKGEKPSASTRTIYGTVWDTFVQTITTFEGAEEPSTVTISQEALEAVTISQEPETITVSQEAPEPRTITISEQIPVTVTVSADPQEMPEPITVTMPREMPEPSTITSWTILANVTPTTVNRWTISTVTNFETVNFTTTVHGEPSTVSRTESSLAEDGSPMTHRGHDNLVHEQEHIHVRRDVDVENVVWCKHCQQYHCCQLPY